jgi:hypothetical protein
MVLVDVNVLVYAHREDAANHRAYREWLTDVLNSAQAYGMSDLVLSGFVRVVTHPRIFDPPSPVSAALSFAGTLREQPNCVRVEPGPRHWGIFRGLCEAVGAKGNLIPDAWFAALAIESASQWITTDGDFGRFPGLDWRHPLA